MRSRILFTEGVHVFLKKEGYTHLRLHGVERKADEEKHAEVDDYILVPWKNNFGMHEESDLEVENIDSTEVIDMMHGVSGIRFLIELPDELAGHFIS